MPADASDDEDFAIYGTPLDPIEEDAVPSKRPTPIEEQVVLDKQGRRRFHGAFTGGFSAGYFNSVGSEEGWTPSAFKSSRSEKASQRLQKAEDFMDEEDKGEFGIAPKVLRATSDYTQGTSRKRSHMKQSTGPIPGQPVLRDILQPVKDTVGVRLLRSMGWRPGQGVGPRLSHRQKKVQQKEIKKSSRKVYGCQFPGSSNDKSGGSGEDSSEESDSDMKSITFAPDDYDAFIVKVKDNVFGIGYEGLDRRPVLSGHVQLFEPSFLGMQEKKKKVAIWGQAFGVGALEEDDEDIYARDDMSQYNFELESSEKPSHRNRDHSSSHRALTGPRGVGAPLEGFVLGKNQPNSQRKFFRAPDLPPGFTAKHETKQSRWDVNSKGENVAKKQGLGRHDLDARVRASILDEPLPKPSAPSTVEVVPSISQSATTLLPPAVPSSASASLLPGSTFRPFVSQPDKQARYERFLDLVKSGQKDLLTSIQPSSMTDWDKEHERSEFEQAARLYKSGIMSDRFVSASQPDDSLNPLAPVERMKHGNEEMQNAAKMKLFGKLTRTRGSWQPCALLCKRFNVPQPSCVLEMEKPNPRSSTFSVFDFLEASSHNTPAKPAVVIQQEEAIKSRSITSEPQPSPPLSASPPPPQPPPPRTERQSEESVAPKTVTSISDTLARLLADDTGQVQPEPEEKPDLFKAIFLSSSEDSDSEDEDTSKDDTASIPGKKSNTSAPRNLSPPRGIFANLDLDALNARQVERQGETPAALKSDEEKSGCSQKDLKQESDLMYGPRLPSALPKLIAPSSSNTSIPQQQIKQTSAIWVERAVKSESAQDDDSSDSDSPSNASSDKRKSSKKKSKHSKHSKHKKDKKHKKHKSKSKHKKR